MSAPVLRGISRRSRDGTPAILNRCRWRNGCGVSTDIVAALDAEDVELEQSLALFEEGIRHVRAAERLLSAAELRVEELLEGEARRREDAG